MSCLIRLKVERWWKNWHVRHFKKFFYFFLVYFASGLIAYWRNLNYFEINLIQIILFWCYNWSINFFLSRYCFSLLMGGYAIFGLVNLFVEPNIFLNNNSFEIIAIYLSGWSFLMIFFLFHMHQFENES